MRKLGFYSLLMLLSGCSTTEMTKPKNPLNLDNNKNEIFYFDNGRLSVIYHNQIWDTLRVFSKNYPGEWKDSMVMTAFYLNYYKNGYLNRCGFIKKGKPFGQWYVFSSSGTLDTIFFYNDNEEIDTLFIRE